MEPKNSNDTASRSPRGFTLIELLVMIVIIAVLAGIGIPAMTRVRTSANQSRCVTQLREWGVIMGSYAGDNTGRIEWSRWEPIGTDPSKVSVYLPYVTSGTVDVTTKNDRGSYEKLLKMRNCPTTTWDKSKTNGPVTYAMIRPNPVESMVSETFLSKISNPSRFIMMTEALTTANGTLSSGGEFISYVKPLAQRGSNLRHTHATVNSLMGDFSVRTMTWKDIEKGLSYWTTY